MQYRGSCRSKREKLAANGLQPWLPGLADDPQQATENLLNLSIAIASGSPGQVPPAGLESGREIAST
ncbi:MAG: hypothetical protein WHT08_18740, partial [Bryobacteraceae bacterium]